MMGCKIRSRRFYLDGKGNKYVPSSLESNNIQGNFCSNHLFSKFLTTKFSGISKVIHVSVILKCTPKALRDINKVTEKASSTDQFKFSLFAHKSFLNEKTSF